MKEFRHVSFLKWHEPEKFDSEHTRYSGGVWPGRMIACVNDMMILKAYSIMTFVDNDFDYDNKGRLNHYNLRVPDAEDELEF